MSNAGTDNRNIASATESRWRLAPGQALRHRLWQDELVLYNDLSGDTHLLEEITLHILHTLQRGPAGVAIVVAALRADGAGDEVDEAAVAQLLAELAALALIEPAA